MEDFNFKKKGRKISLKVYPCKFLEKGIGLMFSRREKAKALLFDFNRPNRLKIHSLFVFFPFLAIWLDNKNRIVDEKVVKSFTFSVSCKKPFYKLLEIPLNKKYKDILELLDED
jgi:uncharacterized membrane protein (UPF0127 family)